MPEDREKSGLAFVQFEDRSVYAVRLINEANFEVAVELSLDGLSMFAFSEKIDPGEPRKEKIRLRDEKTDKPLFRHVLVPAAKDGKPGSILVRGWFINLKKSDEFEVTSYAKSAAKELNNTANVGTIAAIFHAAWKPEDSPPSGEPKRPGSQAPDVGTRKGARFDQIYQVETRRIGLPRDGISVRYDR